MVQYCATPDDKYVDKGASTIHIRRVDSIGRRNTS